jgi:hypothetical protein
MKKYFDFFQKIACIFHFDGVYYSIDKRKGALKNEKSKIKNFSTFFKKSLDFCWICDILCNSNGTVPLKQPT